MEKLNPFLARHKEKTELNQYWYSKPTIQFMVDLCEKNGKRIAFMSTPSIYFSLKDKAIKASSVCLDVSLKEITFSWMKLSEKNALQSAFIRMTSIRMTSCQQRCCTPLTCA